MINNLPLRWFCQRKDGHLLTNTYTGSFGTSANFGILNRPIFEYKVEVVLVNDIEEDSYFKAECSVKEYSKSGTKQLSPIQRKELIGVSEDTLKQIDDWLDEQFLQLKIAYGIGDEEKTE